MKLSRPMAYGLASFSCPILTVAAALTYQSIAYSEFWQSLTPEDHAAGAMMAIAEIVQFALAAAAGLLCGIVLAVASLRSQHRLRGVGLAALVFNGLPLLLLILLWIKWTIAGV